MNGMDNIGFMAICPKTILTTEESICLSRHQEKNI